MDDARAQALAFAGQAELLRWNACPGNPVDCVSLVVQDKRKHIHAYLVLNSRCTGGTTGAAGTAQALAKRSVGRGARRTSPVAPSTTPITAGNAVDEPTLPCFGGQASPLRVKMDDFYATDNVGYLASWKDSYQAVRSGRWATLASTELDMWQQPSGHGGLTGRGYSFVVKDAAGLVLGEASDAVEYISGSAAAAAGVPLVSRCSAHAESYRAHQKSATQGGYVVCKSMTTSVPDKISFSVGVGAEKNLEFCVAIQNTLNASIDAAAAAMNADCIEHPGRYFPADYAPEPEKLVVEVLGFEIEVNTVQEFSGSCTSANFKQVSEHAVGDMVCTVTVPMECTTLTSPAGGKTCRCVRDPHLGNEVTTVCTSK